MESKWWDQMDLGPWCGERVVVVFTAGMRFAQAVATERVKRRGVRQRVRPGLSDGHRVLFVEDAPQVVAEPCS